MDKLLSVFARLGQLHASLLVLSWIENVVSSASDKSTMARRGFSFFSRRDLGGKRGAVNFEMSGYGMDENLSDALDRASQMKSNSGIDS